MRLYSLLICVLCALHIAAFAQSCIGGTYSINTIRQIHDLTPYAEIFVDSTRDFATDAITRREADSLFRPLSDYKGGYNYGPNYWVRIPVRADDDFNAWWLIAWTDYPFYDRYGHWDYMEMMVTDSAGAVLYRQVTGVSVPRSEKSLRLQAGLTATSLSLHGGETHHIYLRFVTEFGNHNTIALRLELRNPEAGLPQNALAQLVTVLVAITVLLGVLSLFFFLFVREQSYLYFFLYLACLSLHYLILHPYLPFADWLVPWFPHITTYAFYALANTTFILFLLFGKHFINLQRLSPRTDVMLNWLLWIWALLLVTELILMIDFHRHVLSPYTLMLLVVLAIGFIVRFAFFKDVLAYFFVGGVAWLLLFTGLGIAQDFLPTMITFNPWPIGQVGQMLIFIAGLAYKIRLNEQAKAEAERIKKWTISNRASLRISHTNSVRHSR